MGEFLVAGIFWQQILSGNADVDHRQISRQTPVIEQAADFQKEKNRNFYLERAAATRERIAERKRALENSSFTRELQTSVFPVTESSKTTVVVAPHPDDEILCCSRTLSEKIENGESVKIVYVTDGDALADEDFSAAKSYGVLRRNESLRAVRSLGLSDRDVAFLGFPDGNLADIDTRGNAQSSYTGQRSSGRNSYFPNSAYTRIRLKENLRKILKNWDPDTIFIPSRADDHPDHRVAGKITREVLEEEKKLSPEILNYTVHRKECLGERCEADQALDFEKLKLIRMFQSQRHDAAHEVFLDQFAAQAEVFESENKKTAQLDEKLQTE
ncbi:PIG-L family deacetylase [bacterium]|jgi:LmbE family N-acetylglucosaminyl deacetylase|nr:PIG-L family deacetylase [bacterium]MBT6832329.1 PIG-L family deacetylase [bacterium]MBT6996774.1 PIG-L family deacetylase [bacterium]MBT7772813.1 PIG-L family deacetylase [bacterium]